MQQWVYWKKFISVVSCPLAFCCLGWQFVDQGNVVARLDLMRQSCSTVSVRIFLYESTSSRTLNLLLWLVCFADKDACCPGPFYLAVLITLMANLPTYSP
mgnify:CR=1